MKLTLTLTEAFTLIRTQLSLDKDIQIEIFGVPNTSNSLPDNFYTDIEKIIFKANWNGGNKIAVIKELRGYVLSKNMDISLIATKYAVEHPVDYLRYVKFHNKLPAISWVNGQAVLPVA